MATNISTIGSGLARDYTDIASWESDTDNDLVTAGDIEVGQCYDDSNFDIGTSVQSITGATTDASSYRRLETAAGEEFDPSDLSGVYMLSANSSGVIRLREEYLRFSHFGVEQTGTASTSRAIRISDSGNQFVDSCVGICRSSSDQGAVFHSLTTGLDFYQCIAIGSGGTGGADYGFFFSGASVNNYNSIAYAIENAPGAGIGFKSDVAGQEIKNCHSSSSGNVDYETDGTDATADSNIASDTTAYGTNPTDSIAATDLYVDPANFDFTPKGSAASLDNGVSLNGSFTEDFAGNARPDEGSPWETGPFELVNTPVTETPSELDVDLEMISEAVFSGATLEPSALDAELELPTPAATAGQSLSRADGFHQNVEVIPGSNVEAVNSQEVPASEVDVDVEIITTSLTLGQKMKIPTDGIETFFEMELPSAAVILGTGNSENPIQLEFDIEPIAATQTTNITEVTPGDISTELELVPYSIVIGGGFTFVPVALEVQMDDGDEDTFLWEHGQNVDADADGIPFSIEIEQVPVESFIGVTVFPGGTDGLSFEAEQVSITGLLIGQTVITPADGIETSFALELPTPAFVVGGASFTFVTTVLEIEFDGPTDHTVVPVHGQQVETTKLDELFFFDVEHVSLFQVVSGGHLQFTNTQVVDFEIVTGSQITIGQDITVGGTDGLRVEAVIDPSAAVIGGGNTELPQTLEIDVALPVPPFTPVVVIAGDPLEITVGGTDGLRFEVQAPGGTRANTGVAVETLDFEVEIPSSPVVNPAVEVSTGLLEIEIQVVTATAVVPIISDQIECSVSTQVVEFKIDGPDNPIAIVLGSAHEQMVGTCDVDLDPLVPQVLVGGVLDPFVGGVCSIVLEVDALGECPLDADAGDGVTLEACASG